MIGVWIGFCVILTRSNSCQTSMAPSGQQPSTLSSCRKATPMEGSACPAKRARGCRGPGPA